MAIPSRSIRRFLPGLLVAPLGGTYTLVDHGAPRSGPVTY